MAGAWGGGDGGTGDADMIAATEKLTEFDAVPDNMPAVQTRDALELILRPATAFDDRVCNRDAMLRAPPRAPPYAAAAA